MKRQQTLHKTQADARLREMAPGMVLLLDSAAELAATAERKRIVNAIRKARDNVDDETLAGHCDALALWIEKNQLE